MASDFILSHDNVYCPFCRHQARLTTKQTRLLSHTIKYKYILECSGCNLRTTINPKSLIH